MISYPPALTACNLKITPTVLSLPNWPRQTAKCGKWLPVSTVNGSLFGILAEAGLDVSSAQIVLDSLLISVFLWVKERQRLHSVLHARSTEATAAA